MNRCPELVPGAAGTRNCGGSGLDVGGGCSDHEVDYTSADVGDSDISLSTRLCRQEFIPPSI